MVYNELLKSNRLKKKNFIKLETIELVINIKHIFPMINL